jgi:hypothetical protein
VASYFELSGAASVRLDCFADSDGKISECSPRWLRERILAPSLAKCLQTIDLQCLEN